MKKIKYLLLTAVLFSALGQAFAAPMNAKFYTTNFDPKTGEVVEMDLKVEGTTKNPIYTVKVNLEYDKSKLKFVSSEYQKGFIPVTPDELTDVVNGKIIRTAGYPSGLKVLTSIIKYKFKTIAPGEANVKIVGDSAFNEKNENSGIQNKKITLNIKGEALKEEVSQNTNVTLNISGADTYSTDSNYPFKIEHAVAAGAQVVGTTSVSVFDVNGEKVLMEDRAFQIGKTTSLDFSINSNVLIAGRYSLVAESSVAGVASGRTTKTVTVTGGNTADLSNLTSGTSDNVFVNIWNAIVKFVIENIYKIVGLLFIILLLKFIFGKLRRYRRRDR